MKPLKIIICGAKGRMGVMLCSCAQHDPELQLVGGVDIGDRLDTVIGACDVVVDFSVKEMTVPFAEVAAKHKKALIVGTTGHSVAEKDAVLALSRTIPIVWTANFSTGVNVLFWMADKVSRTLGGGFDVEIVETHHKAKKDAPSGTAKRLQEILKQASGKEPPSHALRIGDVVGEHTVFFAGSGERLELTHRATSRETFARGALLAAKWAAGKAPGLYDMQDVLGLR